MPAFATKHLLPTGAWLVASLLACSAAQAESTPYYFGGSLGVNQVSNIYRQNNNTNNDTVATAGLLAGIDQRFGRQRIYGDGSLQTNRYRRNSELNNRSYSAKLALDWATLERLSGTIGGSKSRSLATYNVGNGITPIFKKNIVDESQVEATARLGVMTKLSLEVSAEHRSRSYSALEYASLNYRHDRGSLGIVYRPSELLRLGVAARRTNGEFPQYSRSGSSYVADEFTRDDIDLTARWTASGVSSFGARLSHGKSKHENSLGRDFSGSTGSIVWDWLPTSRLSLSTALSRDTGLETSFFNFFGGAISADQNRLTTALQISGNYELTGKIFLSAGARMSRGDRIDEFLGQRVVNNDRDKSLTLGARWQYSRSLLFSCQANRSSRDSTTPLYVYSANSYGCNGQFVIN